MKLKILGLIIVMLAFASCGKPDIPEKRTDSSIVEENEEYDNENSFDEAKGIVRKINDVKIEVIKTKDNKKLILVDTSKHIYFKSNSYDVVSKKKMEKLLKKMAFIKNMHIELVGHTDSNGPDKYNQFLSELRAKSVYNQFIKMGVDKDNIDYIGYGEEQPLVSNATPDGRKTNRRVEILISQNNDTIEIFMNNRNINAEYLNNHNNINPGKVKKSIKGLTKNKSDYEIKKIQKQILTPKRKGFIINIQRRKSFIYN
jgi:outer membrane protein OmpA-like peptidoglycan-associated protein